ETLFEADFSNLKGYHVGLIANHTSRIGDRHLIDIMSTSPFVDLVALFGPEHGIRGDADAGEVIADGIDLTTGVPVFSLYGAVRRPTPEMLAGVDALVFDIQDVGARFYTFISTLGLSMQSAAEAGIPFVVMDRPNPLGGVKMEGFVLDTTFVSFVGQYPIPVRHGLTIGELALMIKGEAWLPGLDNLDLRVIRMTNWSREMLWPDTHHDWIPTSPNLPTFETALMYPGTCFFEATSASEGRGTPLPFLTVGAPWMDADAVAHDDLDDVLLTVGLTTPVDIPGKSSNPKWKDTQIQSISIEITDAKSLDPVSTGLELIARMYASAPEDVRPTLLNERWLSMLGGTDRLKGMLEEQWTAEQFRDAWADDLKQFGKLRTKYLLYD
ncbi:MAG: DUF1343 domain-containing protein, partial [Bacteroidetes bacterium]|nr:DUF1343 domain-containing protein [Bacteroidota bacterium]